MWICHRLVDQGLAEGVALFNKGSILSWGLTT